MKHFTEADFSHPEFMADSILSALDTWVDDTGLKPIILSDWRPYDESRPGSQHCRGTAVDVWFPASDPVSVYAALERSGLFDGIGLYLNEKGVVSFHLDTRGDRARWGAFIQPWASGERDYEYVSLTAVLNSLQEIPLTTWIILATVVIMLA